MGSIDLQLYLLIIAKEGVVCHRTAHVHSAACTPVLQVKGEIIIGEFASANDPDEYEWTVTAEGTGTAQDKLKSHVEKLRSPILEKLGQYTSAVNSLV